MKKLMILLCLALAIMTGNTNTLTNDYKIITATADTTNSFILDDGSIITLYNDDTLILNETYVLLIDPVNDNEILNYDDLETYELNNHEFIK